MTCGRGRKRRRQSFPANKITSIHPEDVLLPDRHYSSSLVSLHPPNICESPKGMCVLKSDRNCLQLTDSLTDRAGWLQLQHRSSPLTPSTTSGSPTPTDPTYRDFFISSVSSSGSRNYSRLSRAQTGLLVCSILPIITLPLTFPLPLQPFRPELPPPFPLSLT